MLWVKMNAQCDSSGAVTLTFFVHRVPLLPSSHTFVNNTSRLVDSSMGMFTRIAKDIFPHLFPVNTLSVRASGFWYPPLPTPECEGSEWNLALVSWSFEKRAAMCHSRKQMLRLLWFDPGIQVSDWQPSGLEVWRRFSEVLSKVKSVEDPEKGLIKLGRRRVLLFLNFDLRRERRGLIRNNPTTGFLWAEHVQPRSLACVCSSRFFKQR